MLSLREASCWSVDVVNGGAGLRFSPIFDALHRKRLLLHLGEDLVDLLLAVQLPLFGSP